MNFQSLRIPQYLRAGIMINKRGKEVQSVIIGSDSETCQGPPFTFQFFSDEMRLKDIHFLKKEKPFEYFLSFLDSLPEKNKRNDSNFFNVYFTNLKFDMLSLFYNYPEILNQEQFDFEYKKWNISGVYADVCFCTLKKGRKTVRLLDTSAFFYGSLERLAGVFCPALPKLKPPKNLGQKIFTSKDKKFCEYALRDSEITYHIGKAIDLFHEKYDVSQCVSIAQMSAKIFRHKFLTKTIPAVPRKIMYAALWSYHGGKNNITVARGRYKKVYLLDISSAYPFAMSLLPSFSNSKLYFECEGKRLKKFVPQFGIYRITGTAKKCPWPVIFDSGFKPIQGDFEKVYVTGFELNEALRLNEITVKEYNGFFYDAEQDKEPSPFKGFVDEFYFLKETAKNPIDKMFYKIVLNSLYGKFIQTTKVSNHVFEYDIDEGLLNTEEKHLKAGGLFHPFIASLITGHTRAYIHRLEHEYKALHTSTDGIMTQIKPKEVPGLGGLKIEAFGDLELLRNKLYILYDRKTGEKLKYALHGFHGKIDQLEEMIKTGKMEYEFIKVNKLRESMRRGLIPNKFETRKAVLKLDD